MRPRSPFCMMRGRTEEDGPSRTVFRPSSSVYDAPWYRPRRPLQDATHRLVQSFADSSFPTVYPLRWVLLRTRAGCIVLQKRLFSERHERLTLTSAASTSRCPSVAGTLSPHAAREKHGEGLGWLYRLGGQR